MIRVALLRLMILGAALSALTGCAAISALSKASQPLDVYELRAPDGIAATQRAPSARDVIVELPTTSGALATDRILIRPNALQAQYLPDVRWSEPTPVMVQTLMLRSIEATGRVRYVGREPLGVSGDFAIVTEVVHFEAELNPDGEATIVRIKLLMRVVREQDARIVASRTFEASAPSTSTETTDVIDAFSTASDRVFLDFADWLRGVL